MRTLSCGCEHFTDGSVPTTSVNGDRRWSSAVGENLADWANGTINHFGSCLSGENSCVPYVERRGSIQTLTFAVNIRPTLTGILPLTTDNGQLQSENGSGIVVCESRPS